MWVDWALLRVVGIRFLVCYLVVPSSMSSSFMLKASGPNCVIALLLITLMCLRRGLILGGLYSNFSRSTAVIRSMSTRV